MVDLEPGKIYLYETIVCACYVKILPYGECIPGPGIKCEILGYQWESQILKPYSFGEPGSIRKLVFNSGEVRLASLLETLIYG